MTAAQKNILLTINRMMPSKETLRSVEFKEMIDNGWLVDLGRGVFGQSMKGYLVYKREA